MTQPTTPPPSTTPTANSHISPSLPNSPLPKRPKMSSSAPVPSATSTSAPTPPLLLIKKLSPKATTPTRGSALAAGYDLYSAYDTVIPGRGKALVDTELAIAVPQGTCMLLLSRSVLSLSCLASDYPFTCLLAYVESNRRTNGRMGDEIWLTNITGDRWADSATLRVGCQTLHRYWGGGHRCGLPWPGEGVAV
jgi:dUTPase